MRFTDKQMMDGRRRLKRLLPEAKKNAMADLRESQSQMKILSRRGQDTMEYLKTENFKALVISRTQAGWFVDLVLKFTPHGISDVMGTPASRPLKSREEAERVAPQMLNAFCAQALMNENVMSSDVPRTRKDVRTFTLFNIEIPLPGEAVDISVGVGAHLMSPEDAQAYALGRLAEVCASCGINEETTVEDMKALTEEQSQDVFVVACLAAAAGCNTYPESPWAHEVLLDEDEVTEP